MRIDSHNQLMFLPKGTSLTIVERMGDVCSGHCVLQKVAMTHIIVSPVQDLNHSTLFVLTPETFRPDPDGFAIVSDSRRVLARFRVNNTGAK